jgi:hypothetical protein
LVAALPNHPISRDQVVLKRGPEHIVLRRKPQGE